MLWGSPDLERDQASYSASLMQACEPEFFLGSQTPAVWELCILRLNVSPVD